MNSAVAEQKKPRLTTSAMIASIASEGQRVKAAPFGKAWGAMRLRLLLEPMADLPPLDKWSQIVIDQKPEKPGNPMIAR